MTTIDETAKRVYRATLKKTPYNAGELARRAGFSSGRAISRAIGQLVNDGLLARTGNKTARYTRVG